MTDMRELYLIDTPLSDLSALRGMDGVWKIDRLLPATALSP
jgi:hypothetical protein